MKYDFRKHSLTSELFFSNQKLAEYHTHTHIGKIPNCSYVNNIQRRWFDIWLKALLM